MPAHWAHIYDALIRYFSRYISSCLFKIKHLNGSYDVAKKKIIFLLMYNNVFGLMQCVVRFKVKKHIIFHILYIIIDPLCSTFLKRVHFYEAHRSEKRGVLWLASYPVRCDWPNTSSVRWKCYAHHRIVMCVPVRRHKNNKTHYKRGGIITFVAFVASSQDIITDCNDLYCLFNITMSVFVIGETINN